MKERRSKVGGSSQPTAGSRRKVPGSTRPTADSQRKLEMALERMLDDKEGRMRVTGQRLTKSSSVLVKPGKRGFGRRRKQREVRRRLGRRWRRRGKGAALQTRKMEVGSSNPPLFPMEGRKRGKLEERKGAKTFVVFSSKKEKVKGGECEQDLDCSSDKVCLNHQCSLP